MSSMLIRQALLSLEDDEGRLTPERVVKEARKPESPLHDLFEWDTEKAAYQNWLDRAREIIRTVRVEIVTEKRVISAVAYVRDPAAEPKIQGYVSTLKLRSEGELAYECLVY